MIQIRCDNKTVVAYLNKQGGTRLTSLCYLKWEVLNWCKERQIHLKALYIKGQENVLADLLSRKGDSHEWSLCPGGGGGGGSESVPDLGETSGGSVRKRTEQQAGHILLEGEQSGGVQDRWLEYGLERPGNVCVSPRTSDTQSDSKGEIQHDKDDTGGSKQESKTVDVSARRATVGHSKGSTSKGKATKGVKLKSVPSGSRKPSFSCLDDRRKLRQKGFRRGAAKWQQWTFGNPQHHVMVPECKPM